MESRKEKANALHDKGYNCAQAVACTFADKVDVDEEVLFRACEGLGSHQKEAEKDVADLRHGGVGQPLLEAGGAESHHGAHEHRAQRKDEQGGLHKGAPQVPGTHHIE